MKDPRRARADALIRNVSASFKTDGLLGRAKNMRRKFLSFSSGSISLDLALGKGWPFGRMVLLLGEYSTGKTVLALKASGEVKKIDSITKLKPPKGATPDSPGITLFVDFEGTFDEEWAKCHGFDPETDYLCVPEYAQQGIDVVQAAIEENIVDLIIVDSVAAMTPKEEAEASAEDWQVGLQARIIGKALRKWQAALQEHAQKTGLPGPCIMLLNQFRLKVGKEAMFGDPRIAPGGKAQHFYSSITLMTQSQAYEDTTDKEVGTVNLRGQISKNKMAPPKKKYNFEMALKNLPDLPKGHVNNARPLVDQAKKYKLLKKVKGGYEFGSHSFRTQDEVIAKVRGLPELQNLMWRSVLQAAES